MVEIFGNLDFTNTRLIPDELDCNIQQLHLGSYRKVLTQKKLNQPLYKRPIDKRFLLLFTYLPHGDNLTNQTDQPH